MTEHGAQVGLVINSELGAIPYQCDLLQIVFESE